MKTLTHGLVALILSGAGQTVPQRAPSGASLPSQLVGDSKCMECHQEQGKTYEATAHRLTLQLPSTASILGSFLPGSNTLQTLNPATSLLGDGLTFRMIKKDGHFYETEIRTEIDDADQSVNTTTHSESINLVTGSGVRGQSYLYWKGNELYELPVSFWTDGHQWINSPGFPDGSAIFDRPVSPRCLECHTTFIQTAPGGDQENAYVASSLVAGITCEKCHGPGRRHVGVETSNGKSGNGSGHEILNPRNFSRDRQIDVCALCHNGAARDSTRPAFSFTPGQSLDDFFAPDAAEPVATPDVHGNQVALLERSRCFQASKTLTCSTCHNEHTSERPANEYSDRCLACHDIAACGMYKSRGDSIRSGCIACHMPLQITKAIISQTGGRVARASMRTHWIRVYQ